MRRAQPKPQLLSDQLREILDSGLMTRYRLAKATGIDQGQLSKFMRGTGGLSLDSLDKIGGALGLRFVVDNQAERQG